MDNYSVKDLRVDTEQFLNSQLGKLHMGSLEQKAAAVLSDAQREDNPYPDRAIAKYAAYVEIIAMFRSPLDIDDRLS